MSDTERIFGLTNDFLFKEVFGQEKNKKPLIKTVIASL